MCHSVHTWIDFVTFTHAYLYIFLVLAVLTTLTMTWSEGHTGQFYLRGHFPSRSYCFYVHAYGKGSKCVTDHIKGLQPLKPIVFSLFENVLEHTALLLSSIIIFLFFYQSNLLFLLESVQNGMHVH